MQPIPIQSFLHRIFPTAHYDDPDFLIKERIFKPRNDCAPVSLSPPIDWEAEDRMDDRNWRMQLQGWTAFHSVMNFFDDYSNKLNAISYFLEVAHDWWDHYGNDPTDLLTTRMPKSYAWYDMSVGFRALIIGFFLNRIKYHSLDIPKNELSFIIELAEKHIANLSYQPAFSLNNHGLFQVQGLMCLLHETLPENFEGLHSYALKRMEELITNQFDPSGIHLEHSPHYHFYVTATFEALADSGWYESSPVFTRRLRSAQDKRKWLVDPLRRAICVGDSILTEQTTVEFPKNETEDLISDFHSSGYAIVRSGWSIPEKKSGMLFLMASYHSKAHKHRDCLSIDWFDKGQRILCDSGKYGYKSDKYRNYFLSSRAHNSVEIDGFDIIKIKPYGTAIKSICEYSPGVYRVEAALEFPAIKHTRRIYYKIGHWLIIEDELNFAKSRAFTQWLHLDPSFSIEKVSGTATTALSTTGLTLNIECLDRSLNFHIYRGDEESIQGYISERDYQFKPNYALGFSGFDKNKKIVTILSFGKSAHIEATTYAELTLATPATYNNTKLQPYPQRLLNGISHFIFNSLEEFPASDGEYTALINVDDVQQKSYINFNNNRRLLVFFPGATDRQRGFVDFQRHSWHNDFENFDFVSFTDPTIRPDNDISIGWFQHTRSSYGIDSLCRLLLEIISKRNYKQKDVYFFGSSAGGFVALNIANRFPEATVIAINPQIYLYNYLKPAYESMLAFSYNGLSESQVFKAYKNRITCTLSPEERLSPVYIFQNTFDTRHVNKHLRPYISSISANEVHESHISNGIFNRAKLNVILYDNENLGHSPPNRTDTVMMILGAIANNRISI